MLFTFNRHHNAFFIEVSNEITGKINDQYSTVQYYFQLRKTNDSLIKANERLYNKLKQNFEFPDTASKVVVDSIRQDSLENFRRFQYLSAKVNSNSVILPNNYIGLHRGILQGVNKDMGVIDPNNGVVGTVILASNNYSVVMSLLHMQSNVSAKLKKTGELGSVTWDGKDPSIIILKDIGKSVKVSKGDIVVTSGITDRFPYGLLIGTVEEVGAEKSSNYHTIKLRTAANFHNLQFVEVINNLQKQELNELLKQAKKANE